MTGTAAGPPPSAAPERTRLSWRRTVLACTAVTLLTARLAIRDGFAPLRLTVGALALFGWVGILLIGRYRIRSIGESGTPAGWVPAMTASCVAWFAVLGAVLAVLP
jgi:uncharacterized membrane protein YidH (DUF202 family)